MKKYSLQFKRVLSFVLVVLLFGATEMTKTQAQNITFADSNVKAICVANWDTNADGELSYAEAAAVTDLGQVFKNNSSITSFDELQYFINLTWIGSFAFQYCTSLTSIEIPNSVTSIGWYAFQSCTGLTLIEIPNSVTSIGSYVFYNCTGLTSIEIPNSVTSIGGCAFVGCTGLTSIVSLAETPPTLGNDVFYNIPTTIPVYVPCDATAAYQAATGWSSFTNITGLCSGEVVVTVNPSDGGTVTGAGYYNGGEMCVLTATPNSGYSFGNWTENGWVLSTDSVFSFYAHPTTLVANFCSTSPITFADVNVKALCVANWDTNGDGELSYAEAAAVTNLDGVFYNNQTITSFDELQYFTSLTSLGGDLNNCRNLHSVILPPTLTQLVGGALGGCGLLSIIIPKSVITISPNTFNWTSSLEQIIVEEGNPVYDSRENCNAIVETSTNKIIAGCKNTTFPSSVTAIESGAFFGDRSGSTVTIPSTIISLGGNPFVACGVLEQIIVEDGHPVYDSRNNCNAIIETTTNKLVSGCKNTVIPNTVTTIGADAFQQVFSLTSIVIPSSVTSIEGGAFFLTGLQEITIYAATPPLWHNGAFGHGMDMPVHIPCGTLSAYQNAEGWSGFTNYVEMCGQFEGALNGLFSVGENTQVCFSQGNLQYQASTNTWRFAEHQWDFVGGVDYMSSITYGNVYENGVKCDNALVSSNYAGWFDLFGWGTSGYDHGAVCYQPWSTSDDNSNYYAFGSASADLSGQADWGYNAISNGGNQNGQWRTLSKQEWEYLIEGRNTPSGVRFAKAQVNGVYGIMILPDDWDNTYYEVNNPNDGTASFTSNEISATAWSNLESHGALFLPKAGLRVEGGYFGYGECNGDYWSTTVLDDNDASRLMFDYNYVGTGIWPQRRFNGRCVRLVRPAQSVTSYSIEAEPNPLEGGTITGVGSYQEGETCTLTATPNQGYHFVNWTKDNVEVSTESTYSFTVSESASYVANFELNVYITSVGCIPQEGGTIQVEGTGVHGSTVTLTAVPNAGYAFVNWTKNSVVVSTNASFSFTVSETATYVANFELQGQITNHWTPIGGTQYNMTVSGVILINGVEQTSTLLEVGAFCGDECRGSMMPEFFPPSSQYVVSLTIVSNQQSGEAITFRLYDHATQQELDHQCVNGVSFVSNEIIGSMGDWFQFAFNNEVSVSATLDPIGAGSVTGTGNYLPGTAVTLTATANEGYAFSHWSIGSETVSTDNPYTFTLTSATSLVAHFNILQISSLSTGWNWWSTYIEQEGINGLTMLEQSLGHNGLMIKTQVPYVQNYYQQTGYDYWFGSLTNVGLANETGYQISVSANCQAVMEGAIANPSSHPITIQSGWNWIGYPVSVQQSLSTALSGFIPMANDLIKGQGSSATYYDNYGWFPTSFTLTPGQSYMYYSNAQQSKTLTYNSGRGGDDQKEVPERVWVNDIHAHAGNAVVIATVTIDGEERHDDNLELGAFVDGECRGSAVLQYFEPTGRWYAILTVSGEEDEVVTFAVVNRYNGTINGKSSEILTYSDNAIVGSLDNPYEVHFGTTKTMNIYPNPIECNTDFSVDIPSDEVITEVLIFNALGEAVLYETGNLAGRQMRGIKRPGVYLVKVVCRSSNVFTGRLIVK